MKKKVKRNLYKTNSGNAQYSTIIKITIGVVLFIGLVYLITALVTGEIKLGNNKDNIPKDVTIQYEEIISGGIFNRKDKEYYVLLFNFTDTFASYYLSVKDTYAEKDNALNVYIVDLEKKINKEIILEDDQQYTKYPNNYADLKVSSPTLLKIKDHRVIDRIIGRDDILNLFDKLNSK